MGVTVKRQYSQFVDSLGCLLKKTDSLAHKKPPRYLGWGQEIRLLHKQTQVILNKADFELHPIRMNEGKRKVKVYGKRERLLPCPPRAIAPLHLETLARHSPHLPIHSLS